MCKWKDFFEVCRQFGHPPSKMFASCAVYCILYTVFTVRKGRPRPVKHTFIFCSSYVYWTVHHLYSWIKRDQLDVTCFFISLFNAQHVSDVNTSILRSLRFICWVISWVVLLWFDVCWCYGVVRLGWCGILMQAEAVLYSGQASVPTKILRG